MANQHIEHYKARAHSIEEQRNQLLKDLREKYKGVKVLVISNFNNQPIGRSKPSWKNRRVPINDLSFHDGEIIILLEGAEIFMSIDEVEFPL